MTIKIVKIGGGPESERHFLPGENYTTNLPDGSFVGLVADPAKNGYVIHDYFPATGAPDIIKRSFMVGETLRLAADEQAVGT